MAGMLPFMHEAVLKEKPDDTVRSFGCSVWPVRMSNTRAGAQYDHEGEAPLEVADDCAVPNRYIEWQGRTYQVLEATPHSFVPHTALRLRETRAGG